MTYGDGPGQYPRAPWTSGRNEASEAGAALVGDLASRVEAGLVAFDDGPGPLRRYRLTELGERMCVRDQGNAVPDGLTTILLREPCPACGSLAGYDSATA